TDRARGRRARARAARRGARATRKGGSEARGTRARATPRGGPRRGAELPEEKQEAEDVAGEAGPTDRARGRRARARAARRRARAARREGARRAAGATERVPEGARVGGRSPPKKNQLSCQMNISEPKAAASSPLRPRTPLMKSVPIAPS